MQPDRLGVREHARREVGGARVVRDSPLGPPATGVLLGELSSDLVRALRVQQLKALRDAPVQQPPFRRADLSVRRITQQVV